MVVETTLEVVKFHDDFLEVVRVAANGAVGKVDGEYWVSVKKVCENLGIDFNRQHQKLKSDPAYDTKLIKVKTAGGMQEMFCIPLNQLNGWLYTINPNKVKAVAKEKLLAYKKECQEVLYNHFLQKIQPQNSCPYGDCFLRENDIKEILLHIAMGMEQMSRSIEKLADMHMATIKVVKQLAQSQREPSLLQTLGEEEISRRIEELIELNPGIYQTQILAEFGRGRDDRRLRDILQKYKNIRWTTRLDGRKLRYYLIEKKGLFGFLNMIGGEG